MSAVEFTCECGEEVRLDIPGGDGVAARWARAMARRQSRCDRCVAKAVEADEAAARLQAREERRGVCEIPRKWRGVGLDDLEPREGQERAHEAASEWATTKDAGGLMLCGGTGTGKTRLAASACWSRLERWRCRYASVAQSMARLSETFSEDGRRAAVRVFAGAGPIVLDDFDKTRLTDFGREQLFAAVDNRYQAEAPMLITTNLTPPELRQRYGDPIGSRLLEYCRIKEVAGCDQRLRALELRVA